MTANIEDAPVTALVGGGWVGGQGLASGISQTSDTLTVEAAYACSTLGAQDVLSPQWSSFIYLAVRAQTALALRLI